MRVWMMNRRKGHPHLSFATLDPAMLWPSVPGPFLLMPILTFDGKRVRERQPTGWVDHWLTRRPQTTTQVSVLLTAIILILSNLLPLTMRLPGGYAYFETSYKAANRVFSSAALESGSGDMKINVMDDLNGIVVSSNYSSLSSSSISSASASSFPPTNGVFKQSYSVSSSHESDAVSIVPNAAHLISPNISVTGPRGICLNFYYNLDGLSAEKLRILVKGIDSESNQTLWESSTESEGKWIKASVAYAYETTHQVNKSTCMSDGIPV